MYQRFYGLRAKPFSIAPQAEFLYPSRRHRLALELLHYGLATRVPFVVVTGEIGTGKTTLIRHLLAGLEPGVAVASVARAHGGYENLLRWIADAFGLETAAADEFDLEKRVLGHMDALQRQGRDVALVIDEAQGLSAGALEKLRLLASAFQVLLVGQRGLRQRLQEPGLAQLAQRVAVDYHLEPLERDELAPYVRHRLRVAGGSEDLFDDEACEALHEHTRGVPRLVNLLCDFALLYGYSMRAPRIARGLVDEVARDRAGALAQPQPVSSARHAPQTRPRRGRTRRAAAPAARAPRLARG
jgi:type II secretory pathway predicted ATPase ExeA